MTLASNKEEEHLLNSGCEEKAATSDDKGPASTSSSSRFDWRSWRDKRPYLVEPPLFLFYIAYKACLPLTEQFIFSFTAAKYLPNKGDYYLTVSSRETACQANVTSRPVDWLQDAIHADSSNWLCYLNLARNIPALFTTLLICSFTDVSGRKFGLILPCLGAVMKGLVYLIVIYGKAPIIYLFIGNILEGLGGSHMTLHSSAFAYLSEVLLNDRHRSFRFTIVQAVICLATAIGNLVMGHIIRTWGYAVSFLFVTVLFLATTLHVIFLLPESKPAASQRDERDFSVSHTLRNAVTVFHVYSREDRNPTTNLKLRLLLLVFTFDSLIVLGRNDVDVLYMMGMPFCWPSVVIGYYQALRYVLQAAVGLVCFPVMQLWFSDSCLGFVGTVSGIASNALMAINLNSLLLWFVPIVSLGSAVVSPIAEAMMSGIVESSEQGALFASVGVVQALCDLISGAAFDVVYAATVSFFSGFIFILITVLYVLSGIVFLYLCKNASWRKSETAIPFIQTHIKSKK